MIILTSKIICKHLQSNSLLPCEQNVCYVNSRRTKDQLLIDKLLMFDLWQNHNNLNMAWIDFCKAYDSVPHDWLLKCLNGFGVHRNICSLIAQSMWYWRTILTLCGVVLGNVAIQRGIFHRDSLSPLLFVIALMPLSYLLREYQDTKKARL